MCNYEMTDQENTDRTGITILKNGAVIIRMSWTATAIYNLGEMLDLIGKIVKKFEKKKTDMKMSCNACGVHFGDEFEKTLKAPCNYWESIGMSLLSKEHKKKVWDALNILPFDEIGITYNLAVSFQLFAQPIPKGMTWDEIDPEYKKKNEKQRREFQREYFIKQKDEVAKKKRVQVIPIAKQKKVIIN